MSDKLPPATLLSKLIGFVRNAQQQAGSMLLHTLTQYQLTVNQHHILAILGERDGATMADIARLMGHTPAAATGLVDRLEATGQVQRGPVENDRRKIVVRITPEGRKLLDQIATPLDTSLRERLARLTHEEQTALLILCQKTN